MKSRLGFESVFLAVHLINEGQKVRCNARNWENNWKPEVEVDIQLMKSAAINHDVSTIGGQVITSATTSLSQLSSSPSRPPIHYRALWYHNEVKMSELK